MTRPPLLTETDILPRLHQHRSRRTRSPLATAALALFAERGYASTSIHAIADRAELAVGTVYQHVRSKRHLLQWLMDDLLKRLDPSAPRFTPSSDRQAAIRSLFVHAVAFDQESTGAVRAWHEACLSDAHLAEHDTRMREWTSMRIMDVLRTLHQLPHARTDVDLVGLGAIVQTLYWHGRGRAGSESSIERDRWVEAATYMTYHTMFLDGRPRARAWRPTRGRRRTAR
jgi:AcrR family transcriptional regulator